MRANSSQTRAGQRIRNRSRRGSPTRDETRAAPAPTARYMALLSALTLLAATAMMLLATTANAGERFSFNIAAESTTDKRGARQIDLIKLIEKQNPRFDTRRYEINKVSFVAKSRLRDGRAWLNVGGLETPPIVVEGTAQAFRSTASDSYIVHELTPANPRNTKLPWVLLVRGNVKMSRVILFLDDCSKGECIIQRESTTRRLSIADGLLRLGPRDTRKIDLRDELQRAYGGLDLKDAQLVSVELSMKAREKDTSLVFVSAGNTRSRAANIRGGLDVFRNPAADSWQTEVLEPNAADTTRGAWELEFRRGTVRVRELLVTTVDKAMWRPNLTGPAPAIPSSSVSSNTPVNQSPARCSAQNCAKGKTVVARASGPRSCYASSDGRQIDRRDGALVTWSKGCKDGACQQKRERCFESRTCRCEDGSGRCKAANACSPGGGCQFGYQVLKMHCDSGLFEFK